MFKGTVSVISNNFMRGCQCPIYNVTVRYGTVRYGTVMKYELDIKIFVSLTGVFSFVISLQKKLAHVLLI